MFNNIYDLLSEGYDDRRLPKDYIEDLAISVIRSIVAIDKNFQPDWKLLSLDLEGYDSTNCYGNTVLRIDRRTGKPSIVIQVSKYILELGLEELFINTIAHEYCHYLQDVEMLADPRFDKTAERGKEFADPAVSKYYRADDDDGHGECWFKYVNKVNAALNLKFPITPHPDSLESDLFNTVNADLVTFQLCCPNGCFAPVNFFETNFEDIAIHDRGAAEHIAAIILLEDSSEKSPMTCNECGANIKMRNVGLSQVEYFKFKAEALEFLKFLFMTKMFNI